MYTSCVVMTSRHVLVYIISVWHKCCCVVICFNEKDLSLVTIFGDILSCECFYIVLFSWLDELEKSCCLLQHRLFQYYHMSQCWSTYRQFSMVLRIFTTIESVLKVIATSSSNKSWIGATWGKRIIWKLRNNVINVKGKRRSVQTIMAGDPRYLPMACTDSESSRAEKGRTDPGRFRKNRIVTTTRRWGVPNL